MYQIIFWKIKFIRFIFIWGRGKQIRPSGRVGPPAVCAAQPRSVAQSAWPLTRTRAQAATWAWAGEVASGLGQNRPGQSLPFICILSDRMAERTPRPNKTRRPAAPLRNPNPFLLLPLAFLASLQAAAIHGGWRREATAPLPDPSPVRELA
jgi:hypothetical protein